MKLWLDDARRPDDGWIWVVTSAQCIDHLQGGPVDHLALDHDLGILDLGQYSESDSTEAAEAYEDTGYRVVLWMEEHGVWPPVITIHSDNPAGVKKMRLGIMASGLYRMGPSQRRFDLKQ